MSPNVPAGWLDMSLWRCSSGRDTWYHRAKLHNDYQSRPLFSWSRHLGLRKDYLGSGYMVQQGYQLVAIDRLSASLPMVQASPRIVPRLLRICAFWTGRLVRGIAPGTRRIGVAWVPKIPLRSRRGPWRRWWWHIALR